MTNGELFIVENPNIEFKLNGSCIWIYFDGTNHYTMPISWWEQEISLFDKIRAEIEQTFLDDGSMQEYTVEECLRIIDKYKAEVGPQESENKGIRN